MRRIALARPRFLAAALILALLTAALPIDNLSTRLLAAWDVAIVLYLVLVAAMMAGATLDDLQRRADLEDAGAVTILIVTVAAAVASFVAIGAELHVVRVDGKSPDLDARRWLAASTILLSWLFVHTMFALHYAREFYRGDEDRRGLAFPNRADPDYWDFLYFAFTMGAASQTSDVAVTASHMRRLVLAHTVLSFLFNTTVLALAVNVGAALI